MTATLNDGCGSGGERCLQPEVDVERGLDLRLRDWELDAEMSPLRPVDEWWRERLDGVRFECVRAVEDRECCGHLASFHRMTVGPALPLVQCVVQFSEFGDGVPVRFPSASEVESVEVFSQPPHFRAGCAACFHGGAGPSFDLVLSPECRVELPFGFGDFVACSPSLEHGRVVELVDARSNAMLRRLDIGARGAECGPVVVEESFGLGAPSLRRVETGREVGVFAVEAASGCLGVL